MATSKKYARANAQKGKTGPSTIKYANTGAVTNPDWTVTVDRTAPTITNPDGTEKPYQSFSPPEYKANTNRGTASSPSVSSSSTPIQSAPIEPVKQWAVAKPVATGGSISSMFSTNNLQKMLDKYGGDKRALYSDVLNKAKEKWTDWSTLLRQLNTAFQWFTYTPPTSTILWVPEVGADEPLPETWIPSLDTVNSIAEENRKEYWKFLLDTKAEADKNILEMQQVGEDSIIAQAQIIKERSDQIDQSFADIFGTIKELETEANNLFDQNVLQAVNARAKQLAAQGVLTNAQAASAVWLSLTKYKANAELKRTEIMVKVNEQMVSALEAKQNALDAVLVAKWLNEQQKADLAEKVSTNYNNILQNYANMFIGANTSIDNQIANSYAQAAQIEIAEKTKEVEYELANEFAEADRALLDTDPDKRLDYIMATTQATDPNLNRYVATLLQWYVQDGTFLTTPLNTLITDIFKQAGEMLLADVRSTSAWGGGWSTTGLPSTWITDELIDPVTWEPIATTQTPEEILEIIQWALNVNWQQEAPEVEESQIADFGNTALMQRIMEFGKANMTATPEPAENSDYAVSSTINSLLNK